MMLALAPVPSAAVPLTFDSSDPAFNGATRSAWLAAIGIGSPENLVDFESGFANNQNISGVSALFPDGLVIRDTSVAGAAIVRSGASVINGNNPVGVFAVTQGELPYLVLDFSARPVDYVGFQDIDHAGTSGIISFTGGSTLNFVLEGAQAAEFFGIFRNDMPTITMIRLDASGDGRWGVDNIEYGAAEEIPPVPEPATLVLVGTGLAGALRRARRRRSKV
jgi:hypothetical protein